MVSVPYSDKYDSSWPLHDTHIVHDNCKTGVALCRSNCLSNIEIVSPISIAKLNSNVNFNFSPSLELSLALLSNIPTTQPYK